MYYLNTNVPYVLFQETLKSEVYVDKSMMIEMISSKIRTGNKYVCITRPRRFGKTINANMLGAYYTKGYDSDCLFKDLDISRTVCYREHLNKYNVIHIDFSKIPLICSFLKKWENRRLYWN